MQRQKQRRFEWERSSVLDALTSRLTGAAPIGFNLKRRASCGVRWIALLWLFRFKIERLVRVLRIPPTYPSALVLPEILVRQILQVTEERGPRTPSGMVQAPYEEWNATLISNSSQIHTRTIPNIKVSMKKQFSRTLPPDVIP